MAQHPAQMQGIKIVWIGPKYGIVDLRRLVESTLLMQCQRLPDGGGRPHRPRSRLVGHDRITRRPSRPRLRHVAAKANQAHRPSPPYSFLQEDRPTWLTKGKGLSLTRGVNRAQP